jgi:hypothetical protein
MLLTACGGGGFDSADAPKVQRLAMRAPANVQHAAADYKDVVQSLYLAYLGRPADYVGLNFWTQKFSDANLPLSASGFLAAYPSNDDVKQAVDAFANSAESRALFIGKDSTFIDTVYLNAFSRNAEPAGKEFWAGFLKSGQLSRAQVALWVASNGQGDDAVAMAKKLQVAGKTSAAIEAYGATAVLVYGSDTFFSVGRDLIGGVTAATDVNAYQAEIDKFINSLSSAGGSFTKVSRYVGFNYLQDMDNAPSYAAYYRNTRSSAISVASSGSLSFGSTPQRVSWTRDPATDIWDYTAPVKASVGLVISSAPANPGLHLGADVPDIAMLCSNILGSGGMHGKSTDVLVSSAAQEINSAADLAGITLGYYRENCSLAGDGAEIPQPQSLVFDTAGNMLLTTPTGTLNYSASVVSLALQGQKLVDKTTGKFLTIKAYQFYKASGGLSYAIVFHQAGVSANLNSGTLGLWAQQ